MKDRILNKIQVNENGCWIWTGSKHRQGYGSTSIKGKHMLAHRIAWIAFVGEIPPNMKVCHKCDVTSCCNPDHLFLGTQWDNVRDAISKGKYSNRKQGKRRNKLNYEQVQEVKRLSACGMTRKELQKKFEVGETCIAKILTGVSWKKDWTKEI